LSVFRSWLHLHCQIIDDVQARTLVAASTVEPSFRSAHPKGGDCKGAEALGAILAERARGRGVEQVVFDRGGYRYHGRVKALAEAVRKGGIRF
jgi:large subunit ribosomal protein L18